METCILGVVKKWKWWLERASLLRFSLCVFVSQGTRHYTAQKGKLYSQREKNVNRWILANAPGFSPNFGSVFFHLFFYALNDGHRIRHGGPSCLFSLFKVMGSDQRIIGGCVCYYQVYWHITLLFFLIFPFASGKFRGKWKQM